jgi:hypothetical protein
MCLLCHTQARSRVKIKQWHINNGVDQHWEYPKTTRLSTWQPWVKAVRFDHKGIDDSRTGSNKGQGIPSGAICGDNSRIIDI